MKRLLLACAFSCLPLQALYSVSLLVNNAGFEEDTVADGSFNDTIVPQDWSLYDPSGIVGNDYNSVGVLNPTGTSLYVSGAPQDSNVALIFLWPQYGIGVGADVGLQQTLSSTLQAHTLYTLTVQVGNIADIGNPFYSLNGFPGYAVQLLAGGVVLDEDANTLTPPEGEFALSTVQFTTGASHAQLGQALGIRLMNLGNPNSGIEVNFDDVILDAVAVPEPSTWSLLGLALLLVLRRYPRGRQSLTR